MKVRVYFLFIRKVSLFVYIKENLFRLFSGLSGKELSEDSTQGFGILSRPICLGWRITSAGISHKRITR